MHKYIKHVPPSSQSIIDHLCLSFCFSLWFLTFLCPPSILLSHSFLHFPLICWNITPELSPWYFRFYSLFVLNCIYTLYWTLLFSLSRLPENPAVFLSQLINSQLILTIHSINILTNATLQSWHKASQPHSSPATGV